MAFQDLASVKQSKKAEKVDPSSQLNQPNHANQTAHGNRDAKVKMNANKQSRKIGQRASGNRGQDAKNGK